MQTKTVRLNRSETHAKLSEIMTAVKAETGHYPTRADVFREIPPPGFEVEGLSEAYRSIIQRGGDNKQSQSAQADG